MDSEFEGLKNQIYRIRYFFFVIFQFSNPTGLNTLVGTEFFNSRNLFINYNIKGTTRGKKKRKKTRGRGGIVCTTPFNNGSYYCLGRTEIKRKKG